MTMADPFVSTTPTPIVVTTPRGNILPPRWRQMSVRDWVMPHGELQEAETAPVGDLLHVPVAPVVGEREGTD